MSIANGAEDCYYACKDLDCTAFQVFLRNPQSCTWSAPSAKKISGLECLRDKLDEDPSVKGVVHAPYVLNFCHPPDSEDTERAQRLLDSDLTLAHRYGLIGVVIHLGKNVERLKLTPEEALQNYARNVADVLTRHTFQETCVIIETGAGQGTEVGWKFVNLGKIKNAIFEYAPSLDPSRVKFCVDTCHIFSAGYDIQEDPEKVIGLLEKYIGWENVACVHVNDSKTECGSFVDRHADPDHGYIGKESLEKFLQLAYEQNPEMLFILETPAEDVDIREQIDWLRSIELPNE